MRALLNQFWRAYTRSLPWQIAITAILFVWQLVHLYWLGADVIATRLAGQSFWPTNEKSQLLLAIVDYTEIPAILSASLLYTSELRRKWRWHILGLLILLNSQWLHLFWITDEFVEGVFTGQGAGTILPAWLAWFAILIDYAELPVIADLLWRFFRSLIQGKLGNFAREFLAER